MKTMKRHGAIKRVPEDQVEAHLKDDWEFCSKEEWKEKVRDKEKE